MGTKDRRFASSEKLSVWYCGLREDFHGRTQIWRKWTGLEGCSFCSEWAIPVFFYKIHYSLVLSSIWYNPNSSSPSRER